MLMLLLGGNLPGNFKLKPLLVCQSLNPRTLCPIIMASLHVVWKAYAKVWVITAIFKDWFLNHFVPTIECYCMANEIPHPDIQAI